MIRTFIERLFYGLYADELDNEEIMFYYDTLYENITLFADPRFKEDVDDHFYGLISGLCRAHELQGFKRGLSHAFRLAAECTAPSDLTTIQTKAEYEESYRSQMIRAARMRTENNRGGA